MASDYTYTVFIRLPFPRGDFIDPPRVNWDSSKDTALWNILSAVNRTDIDWTELADRFQVPVDFLLQQVAFLTERHAAQLRAQVRKATGGRGSSAASPTPGSESIGLPPSGEPMRRTGSGDPRAPSSLSVRKDAPLPKNDGSGPATPTRATFLGRPQVSRNSSAATAVHTTILPQNAGMKGLALRTPAERPRLSSLPIQTTGQDAEQPSPGPAGSLSSTSSSDSSPVQSRIVRRPPRFTGHDVGASLGDDEGDAAEAAFLPPTQTSGSRSAQNQDLGATLRGDPGNLARRVPRDPKEDRVQLSQTSDSSTGSAALVKRPAVDRRPPGPLSPRRTVELSGRSPAGKGKGKGVSREGSDGTPSMGSSFSDLEDTSVTQSALEEALASKIQDGTIGSRMSTISQAIRSRYLPKPAPS